VTSRRMGAPVDLGSAGSPASSRKYPPPTLESGYAKSDVVTLPFSWRSERLKFPGSFTDSGVTLAVILFALMRLVSRRCVGE
jgi:hypothetical protein